MAKNGRPRAFDDFKRQKFLALIQLGYDDHRAAAGIGCTATTARREARRDPAFETSWRDAELSSVAMAMKTLRDSAGQNWRAAAWLLERIYPVRYQKIPPRCVKMHDVTATYGDFENELLHMLEDLDDVTRKKFTDAMQHVADTWDQNWRPGNTLARDKNGKLLHTVRRKKRKRHTKPAHLTSEATAPQPASANETGGVNELKST